MDCLFCKIIAGEIPADKVYEDDEMTIIRDIDPKAPCHYLCLPRDHFSSLAEMDERREALVGRCMKKIADLSDALRLGGGYRLVVNQGADAGQTVFHLHIHILAGKKMGWTPA